VKIDAPPSVTAPAATLLVLDTVGGTQAFPVSLDGSGAGHRLVPFGKGTVERVYLLLTNASRRTTCWVGSWYSCSGHPSDDDETFRYEATLVQ
jgi:hypothetical protein